MGDETLVFRWRKLVIMGIVIIVASLLFREVAAALFLNAANLQMLHQIGADSAPPPRLSASPRLVAGEIPHLLNQALRWTPHSVATRWAWGRTALFAGEFEVAADVLLPLRQGAANNSLIYSDLIAALTYDERWVDVVQTYEQWGVPSLPDSLTDLFTDLVALSYLKLASESIASQDGATALSCWRAARATTSDDFYVRYLAYELEKQLKAGETPIAQNDLAATPSSKLRWYWNSKWNSEYIPAILRLVSEGLWSPGGLWGVAQRWAKEGHWASSELLLKAATKKEWATPALYAQLAELYLMQNKYTEAIESLHQAIDLAPSDAWLHFELGQVQEKMAHGETEADALFDAALVSYERANQLEPAEPFALDRLIRLNQNLGRDAIAQEWQSALTAQISGRHPEYRASRGKWIDPEWEDLLQGYDLQEKALEWDVPIPLCLWWSGEVTLLGEGVHQVAADTWLQCVRIPNLISNGGFELDGGTGPMFPTGYVREVYVDTPPSAHGVSLDPLGQRTGKVGWLLNDGSRSSTGLASEAIAVNPEGRLYLQGAWIYSEGGKGYIGHRRIGGTKTRHAFTGKRVDKWSYYGRLISPEPGATSVEVRLLNYRADDSLMYFDDVLFVELEPPAMVYNND